MEPRAAGPLQMPQTRGVRAAAAYGHGKSPQERVARASATDRNAPMKFELLTVAQEGAAAVVTRNRPGRRNALSLGLMQELIACLDEIGRDGEVRAVILGAAGEGVWSRDAL